MCLGNFTYGFDRLDMKHGANSEIDDDFDLKCSYSLTDDIEQTGNFSVLHLNVRSLSKNFDELLDLVSRLKVKSVDMDVIMLCETWLHDNNSMLIDIPGYKCFQQNRIQSRGGGLIIFIKDCLKVEDANELNAIQDGVFEAKFVWIKDVARELYVGELYRIPNSSPVEFNTFVKNLLSKVKGKQIIIGADQNMDLLKTANHKHTEEFLDTIVENGLIPSITLPTRVTHQSGTLIDNIYFSMELTKCFTSNVLLENISDHFPCLVQLETHYHSKRSASKVVFSRKLNDEKMFKLNNELLHINWLEKLDMGNSLEFVYRTFIENLSGALDRIAPLKKCVIRQENCLRQPWMTVALLKSTKKCKRLYSAGLKLGKDSTQWQRYVNYRSVLNRLKKYAKKEYISKEISSYQGNCKKIWNLLKTLLHKNNDKQNIISELIVNGKSVTDIKAICNSFNDHFSTVGKRVTNNLPHNLEAHKKYMRKFNTESLLLSPVSEREVEKLIHSLPNKTSMGVDNLSNVLIKRIKYSIRLPVMMLINKSLLEGKFPNAMKIAKVFALHKGGSKFDLDNYRPISLLTVLSKLLEKAMLSRLTNFFDQNGILYEKQYGFRKGHSTVNAVQQFVSDILCGFEKDFKCLALFLDLRKAFDVCHHGIILSKLNIYGVKDVALSWFSSYLSNRVQFVKIGNTVSDYAKLEMGIPQGSILGPILMSVMINDLRNCLKLSDCILFADDTTVYLFGKNVDFLYIKMQREIELLSSWFNDNLLVVNIKKTKMMLFSPRSQTVNENPMLTFNGNLIERVQSFKLLGIWIDQNLIWDTHVSSLLKTVVPFKYAMYKFKAYLPLYCLRTLYFGYIHSRLLYGISIWGPMLKKDMFEKLVKIQKCFIRIINDQNIMANSSPLFLRSKVLKLEDLLTLELLKIMYLYRCNKLPLALMKSFSERQHTYGTRNCNTPKVISHKSNIFNSSFLCKVITESEKYKHLFSDSLPSLKTFCTNFKYEKFRDY